MKRVRKLELLADLSESIIRDSADVFLIFVDLCGSTEYKQNIISHGLPDTTWILRQLTFLQRVAKLITRYNGVVVKTIGDEVFGYFEATTDPELVLKCAIEAIQSCKNLKTYSGKSRIDVKASIDVGLTYNGSLIDATPFDPMGSPVDRCARLNSLAGRNEILLSDEFITTLKDSFEKSGKQLRFKLASQTSILKGIGKAKYYRLSAR